MPLGMIFWVLMILWFFFGLYWYWPVVPTDGSRPAIGPIGGHLLLFVLFFIVGWKLFGFVVQQ